MSFRIGGGVQILERADWNARPSTGMVVSSAPFGWTQHWEGPSMGIFPHEACPSKLRGIQNFHMDGRGWHDIAYNWVPCPHGVIFEGRGLGLKTGANGTVKGNAAARAVCALWGINDPFTEQAKHAIHHLGKWLVYRGDCGPNVNCHRDWKPTQCPGDQACGWIKAGLPDPYEAQPDPTPKEKKRKMDLATRPDGVGVDLVVLGQDRAAWWYGAASHDALKDATPIRLGGTLEQVTCTYSGETLVVSGQGGDNRPFTNRRVKPWDKTTKWTGWAGIPEQGLILD